MKLPLTLTLSQSLNALTRWGIDAAMLGGSQAGEASMVGDSQSGVPTVPGTARTPVCEILVAIVG